MACTHRIIINIVEFLVGNQVVFTVSSVCSSEDTGEFW